MEQHRTPRRIAYSVLPHRDDPPPDGDMPALCGGVVVSRAPSHIQRALAPKVEPYKIHAGPPLLSQVCLRCGAEVGSRAIHDAWHAVTGGSTPEADSATGTSASSRTSDGAP